MSQLGHCGGMVPTVRTQQPVKVARIRYLGLGPASAWSRRVDALRVGLRDLGWIEGKNIVIEFRWADDVDQLPGLAAELVQIKVDVIFAPSSTMVEPARQATSPPDGGEIAVIHRPSLLRANEYQRSARRLFENLNALDWSSGNRG
jgi:hypothetical protein